MGQSLRWDERQLLGRNTNICVKANGGNEYLIARAWSSQPAFPYAPILALAYQLSTQTRAARQAFRLAELFFDRASTLELAGAQQTLLASSATRLQSSGCPSQHSLIKYPISARMPSTFER